MAFSDNDPERSWRAKGSGRKAAELAVDVLDLILELLDAIF